MGASGGARCAAEIDLEPLVARAGVGRTGEMRSMVPTPRTRRRAVTDGDVAESSFVHASIDDAGTVAMPNRIAHNMPEVSQATEEERLGAAARASQAAAMLRTIANITTVGDSAGTATTEAVWSVGSLGNL